MSIIGNLPNTLNNGTTADATQVMADFNYIVTQVNANGQPLLPAIPSFSGLVLNEPGNSGTTLTINGTNDTNGANLKLVGNGATTPSKTFRAFNGALQVMNDGYTSVLMSLDDSGNFAAAANVTAYSDERLKRDWSGLPVDFIERLARVKYGTYTRIDIGVRQAGVGAASLREVLPEAVVEGELLSVAYGNAALVSVIKLAERVLELEERLAALELTK
ncbi:tail fiber domain-containing protein [Burkholderia sp. RF4-BP95]|uniref:tail fiber domain-containing protein n=1 Tax=Burkholderia sp. RF4-BP95 TaxID=1637845 RepID=UPI0007582076|nr:tail fiber domain-containing protein [Burkholderia sp. RF4-BP95]KUY70806.1 hypothetical protein WS46_32030 [Burkholderia sp. RF4-BP95]